MSSLTRPRNAAWNASACASLKRAAPTAIMIALSNCRVLCRRSCTLRRRSCNNIGVSDAAGWGIQSAEAGGAGVPAADAADAAPPPGECCPAPLPPMPLMSPETSGSAMVTRFFALGDSDGSSLPRPLLLVEGPMVASPLPSPPAADSPSSLTSGFAGCSIGPLEPDPAAAAVASAVAACAAATAAAAAASAAAVSSTLPLKAIATMRIAAGSTRERRWRPLAERLSGRWKAAAEEEAGAGRRPLREKRALDGGRCTRGVGEDRRRRVLAVNCFDPTRDTEHKISAMQCAASRWPKRKTTNY